MDYNTQRQQYIDAQNYFVGDGGRWQDRPRAIALLQQVCYHYDRPIRAAARMLANCLETGESVAMDLHEARRLYDSIGDAGGVSRCDRKIQIPGSDGYGPFVSEPPGRVSHVPQPRPAPVVQPRPVVAAAPRPVVAAAPKALPTPLPLHIEKIVVLVSESCSRVQCLSSASSEHQYVFNHLAPHDVACRMRSATATSAASPTSASPCSTAPSPAAVTFL